MVTLGVGASIAAALWSVAPSAGPSPEPSPSASPRSVVTPQGVVDLIAASSEPPAPRRERWLGIRFRLHEGWHIYWRNPGDSGGPPSVSWDAPPGVTLDEFEWPAPRRISLSHLVNYGYTGDVVLPVRVRVDATARLRAPITLTAHVRWLVCRDVCVPGNATLRLHWPLATDERASVGEWHRRIEAAVAAVPEVAPASWRPTVDVDRDGFLLHVHPDPPADRATFFPLDPAQIDDAAPQQVESLAGELRIRLHKSAQLLHEPDVLRGVLVLPGRPAVTVAASARR